MQHQEALTLASSLLDAHGLTPQGWTVELDGAKRRFGCCHHRSRKITLSRILVGLNEVQKVRDTILHEIAHALTPGANHGREWRRVARAIGCDGRRCYDVTEVIMPKKPYVGTCPTCGRTITRYRRMKIACSRCCNGQFNTTHLFTWKTAE